MKNFVKGKLRLLGVRCTSLIRAEDHYRDSLLSYLQNDKKSSDGGTEAIQSELTERGKILCPICA